MILNFKTVDRKGRPTHFREKILSGVKKHTIRGNGDRWKPGMTIHFSTGSRTGQYQCFKTGPLIAKQPIVLRFHAKRELPYIIVGTQRLMDYRVRALIANDGLDPEGFRDWFCTPENATGEDTFAFSGWLLHFTDLIY